MRQGGVMGEWFRSLDAVRQAALAGLFTWGLTALGAAVCFVARTVSQRLLAAMMGFAAGVMIAASVWSLLIPAIDMTRALGGVPWIPAAAGLALGAAFLRMADAVVPHLHPGKRLEQAEGPLTGLRRSTLLVLAITLHNVPEGLAVGVVFGGAATLAGGEASTLEAALALTLGIGLQNLPEGVAVSMPLRGAGLGRRKAFWYGQLSGVVEPVSAVIGATAVLVVEPVLPYALAFAAGAMLYVVIEELIPGSQREEAATDLATVSALGGFILMMVLDIALG
ncbi:MAG TPA: ZIP family metal transporter [Longimicrobiales bacterium]|nr:ZIP family metal transporter [Longimicrobiales bacterium]